MMAVTVLERGDMFVTLHDGMPRFWTINDDGRPVMLAYAITAAGDAAREDRQ